MSKDRSHKSPRTEADKKALSLADKELFWYVMSHIIMGVAIWYIYLGVEYLKREGVLPPEFPYYQFFTVDDK